MSEYSEWTRKGASLSDVTAIKEYGVRKEFISKGIQQGKLEYRECAIWGNPCLRLLRGQLEAYIAEQQGPRQLAYAKNLAELCKVKTKIAKLKKELLVLEVRKNELHIALVSQK